MKGRIILLCLGVMTAMGVLGTAEVPPPPVVESGVVNVRAYVSDPDTPADRTSALRAAIAAARTNGSATVLLPAGEYRIHEAIDLDRIRRVQGDGDVRIVQTRTGQPVFICRDVSRLCISGLTFVGGRDQVILGAPKDAAGSVLIKECRFTGARGTAVRFLPVSNRLLAVLQYCTFTGCAQVLEAVSDLTHLQGGLIVKDRSAAGAAAIINRGVLYIDDVRAIVAKDARPDHRCWIENYGQLNCRSCVFGEPDAGRTVVVHRRTRKTSPAWAPSVTLDTCHLYTQGDVAVDCESLPEALTVVKCVGLTDQTLMRVGPRTNLSTCFDRSAPIRLWIGQEQGLSPEAVPEALRPYLQGWLAADGTEALAADGPPGVGCWRRGQLLINRRYSRGPEVEPYGWYCVESGQPGRWRAVRFSLTDGPGPTNAPPPTVGAAKRGGGG